MNECTAGLGYYTRLLRYDAWANAETLGSLGRGDPPERAVRWMGHIVGSGSLWLARLRQEPPDMAVWPEMSIDQCASALARLAESWPRYLDTFSPADLESSIGYRNSLGEEWTSSVADILTHVVVHGAYHRAQIAAAVRESGGQPAYTDFIHAARRRLIE